MAGGMTNIYTSRQRLIKKIDLTTKLELTVVCMYVYSFKTVDKSQHRQYRNKCESKR